MTTLIVPCAGRSSRFPNMKPKWMLTHPEGKIMLQKNLEALNLELFNRIIITLSRDHTNEHQADFFLKQAFPDPKIEIHILDHLTQGPAETVYETIINCKITGPIVIRDSDSYVQFDPKYIGTNFLVGINLNKASNIDRISDKSFIVLNEQGNVADIIEKKIVSDLICLGVYGINSHEDFINIFETIKLTLGIKGEIYVSHIIAYMLGTENSLVNYTEANLYEDWGTLSSWKKVMNNYTTYFLDIDGVLFENTGKYGSKNWDSPLTPLMDNIVLFKELQKNGAQIILTTSRPEKYRKLFEDFFKKEKLHIHSLVMEINHSPRIIVNDFAPTNPYPSCEAINLPRNGVLKNYI